MKKPPLHYTYFLIDPRNDEVFYVGKGVKRRFFVHFQDVRRGKHYNPKLKNKLLKLLSLGLTPIVEKIFEHEDEWPCHANEMFAIAFYGMSNLCNLTNGGEGASGRRWSDEAKAQASAAQSGEKGFWFGKKQSASANARRAAALSGSNNHNFGKPVPIELRGKISAKLKGKHLPATQRKRMSAALLGKPKSLQHRLNISLAKVGKPQPWLEGANNPFFGKKHSPQNRSKIVEGLKRARAAGKVFGMLRSLTKDQEKEVIRLLGLEISQSEIALKFGVSRRTISRVKEEYT